MRREMSIIESFEYEQVQGIKVGRFAWKPNTSCYLFRVGDTLIDCGPPNQWKFVKEFVEAEPVERVLLTHHHEDHSGNAAKIIESKHVPVHIHRRGIPLCRDGYPIQLYRKIIWGTPGRFTAEPLPDIVETSVGYALLPIETPGHSIDMTCIWEPQKKWLFTGDLFITTRPQYLRPEENIHMEIIGLRKVLDLDIETIFCSHRGVVENARQHLQEKYDYLTELRDRVQELVKAGWSLEKIRDELLGKEDFLSYFTRFHFSKINLIKALAKPPEELIYE